MLLVHPRTPSRDKIGTANAAELITSAHVCYSCLLCKPLVLGSTVPSQKRAHGRCTLHWAKIWGWANIRGISIAFKREKAPR